MAIGREWRSAINSILAAWFAVKYPDYQLSPTTARSTDRDQSLEVVYDIIDE